MRAWILYWCQFLNSRVFISVFLTKNYPCQFFYVSKCFCAKSICFPPFLNWWYLNLWLDVLLVAKEILNRHWSIPSPQSTIYYCLLSSRNNVSFLEKIILYLIWYWGSRIVEKWLAQKSHLYHHEPLLCHLWTNAHSNHTSNCGLEFTI